MTAVQIFRAMALNNSWANHRLLAACGQLTPEAFAARRTGFFPSLRATLNHILVIDRFYVDAMEGGRLGPAAWANPEPCLSVTALQQQQSDIDRRLLAVVEASSKADLGRIVAIHRENHIQHEQLERLLLHLFQHQIHHRGQAHAMLSDTLVAPPQLDEFFSASDAEVRATELSELGWSEDELWRT